MNQPHPKSTFATARASGVLLHISSLPSPFGIGDLGSGCFDFIDFLARSGQQYWQVALERCVAEVLVHLVEAVLEPDAQETVRVGVQLRQAQPLHLR